MWSKFLSLLLLPSWLVMAQTPLGLEIGKGNGSDTVRVAFLASSETVYRVYQSLDLASWEIRETVVADGGRVSVDIPTDAARSAFYRLESLGIHPLSQMVWLPPGRVVVGSPPTEVGRYLDKEEPQTRVTLTRGFWISRYEVTQAQFENVMGFNPSLFKGEDHRPVEDVTWFEAQDFCVKLTARERNEGRLPSGFRYRLPTEGEWEYAARAGTNTRFSYGDDPGYQLLEQYAWYGGNSGLFSHPVGQKQPNPWGLYDMHGNVFEWCSDWFGQLPGGWVVDPQGPAGGTDRIIRGGYWDSAPPFCRSASRFHFPPETRISYVGFRFVLAETQ